MPKKLEDALGWASQGWRVFPCRVAWNDDAGKHEKRPLVARWGEVATVDREQIEAWWREWPGASPGWPVSDDRMVVDLDGGLTPEEAEIYAGVELPPTRTHRTVSGGLHLIYATDEPVANSAGKLAPGVDIRGRGGFIVLPSNEGYTVERDVQPVPAPPDLVRRAGQPREREANASEIIGELDAPYNVRRAEAFLRAEAEAGRVAVEGQGGNDYTYRTAALLRERYGLSEATCTDLMLEHWNGACDPPWPADELEAIVEHAYEYANRPGGLSGLDPERFPDAPQGDTPQADEKRSRFQGLTWAEIEGMPPPVWAIENTLTERSIVEIFGPWGTYKSFLALDMVLHMATGRPWAGMDVARPYRVLYVAGEGVYGIKTRARAWSLHHGGAPQGDTFRLAPNMPLFSQQGDLQEFAEANRQYDPDVIVFDTAAHAMAGMNENAQDDASLFMARCAELRNAFNAIVILVHHTGKDEGRGSRGSTVIPAACDTIFRVGSPRPKQAVIEMHKQKEAAGWEKPLGMLAVSVGDSLAFEPGNVDASDKRGAENAVRLDAMKRVLMDGHILGSRALAHEMTEHLAPDESAHNKEEIKAALKRWLSRAASSEWGAPFVFSDAEKGAERKWRHPGSEAGAGPGSKPEGDTV